MSNDDIAALIEENENASGQTTWFVHLYWQDVADENEIVSLVQENWSLPSKPCSRERATTAVMGMRENKGDAVMLNARSPYEAEQLVMQATRLGAKSFLDE